MAFSQTGMIRNPGSARTFFRAIRAEKPTRRRSLGEKSFLPSGDHSRTFWMASNCGHLPMGGSLGWISLIIEKREETMCVEQTRFDRQAGFQGENCALILTEAS